MAEDPPPPITDFLDQNEIDRLLASAVEAQPKKSVLVGSGSKAPDTLKIEPYDFRNPAFLSEGELRRLRLLRDINQVTQ